MEVLLTTLASMFKPDERFIMHRYLSTRIAMAVGFVVIIAWFNYDLIFNRSLHWDLVIIAGVMAATKLLAMAYLRITH